jgi:hypothetical protein
MHSPEDLITSVAIPGRKHLFNSYSFWRINNSVAAGPRPDERLIGY